MRFFETGIRRTIVFSFMLLCFTLVGCQLETDHTVLEVDLKERLQQAEVHFIDVGQGDATLLKGNDFTILIDAGRHDRDDVVPYLKQVGVEKIDLLVGTHPHADHIGQMDKVIAAFPVTEVWMSGDLHTSRNFENVLDAIIAADLDYYEPRAGEKFVIGSLILTVVSPVEVSGDLNNGSISLLAQYGNVSFLFTGDSEKEMEQAMLSRKEPVQATVFQLGHHGSSTSNTESFLKEVSPELAIYSAGADNSYGHPHREVLEALEQMKIPVFGTDREGTMIVTTDGESYELHLKEKAKQGNCINLNIASINELRQIIHLNEERISQLMELRPLAAVDELIQIKGIGAARLNDIIGEGKACVE